MQINSVSFGCKKCRTELAGAETFTVRSRESIVMNTIKSLEELKNIPLLRHLK